MKKLFEVHQKITFWTNEYRILKDNQLVGYIRQKPFALREQFTLYSDEQRSTALAASQARNIIDLAPVFDVTDSDKKHLAAIKKEFKKSFVSSTWSIYRDAQLQKPVFKVAEKNTAMALLRRIWELIPVENFIPFPFKFHFSILAGDKIVGEYTKLTLFRDHYAFYLDEKHASELDEHAWMIFAVLLDAMQSR